MKAELGRAAQIKGSQLRCLLAAYPRSPVETFSSASWADPRSSAISSSKAAPLAIENTLKAAMDWKVRKNMAAGRGERGTEILHFRHAFHGRSGYTMSLTNTDPRRVKTRRLTRPFEYRLRWRAEGRVRVMSGSERTPSIETNHADARTTVLISVGIEGQPERRQFRCGARF